MWTPRPVEQRTELVPVRIEHRRDHKFEKREGGKRGCAVCGAGKQRAVHHGKPASFNVGGSSKNPHAYQGEKRVWMDLLIELLDLADFPRGLGRVSVEGIMTFGRKPGAKGPDQENYRFPLSKALGDALEEGGFIEQDDWTRYEFGRLDARYELGQEGFALELYPSWDRLDVFGLDVGSPGGALF